MSSSDWKPADLKQGDRVACDFGRYGSTEWRIGKVDHVTATQLVVAFKGYGSVRFNRSRGRQIGAHISFETKFLYEATPERERMALEQAQRGDAIRELRGAKWEIVSTDKLSRIVAILGEP